jgi:hypothetical protein
VEGLKNRLVTCLRKKQNPFEKFKDLKEKDRERFVAKCESPEFVANSEYMRQLWVQNELNHHLGNTRYARKQGKSIQEDQRLAEQGVENLYDKFSGWLKHFIRARSKLTEICEITYYNQSTEEVVQRGLRESNQGSNEDERENDALSRVLGTKEKWGCVRGVYSKLTWNEGFPAHKLSYRKRKMVPSAMVGIEEIKRQVRIQLLGDLRPIFESQGLPMPDIGAVGDEESRSSLASTAAAPNTELVDQALTGSVPQENSLGATSGPSPEPDTINTLAHPTPCNSL